MRLAILSDIHGNLPALERVLADLPRHGADLTINLGDCATGPLWPRETVELLDTLMLATVRGNHDRLLVEAHADTLTPSMAFTRANLTPAQCAALHQLPATVEPAPGVLAVHGTPTDDSSYLLETSSGGPLQLATPTMLSERLRGVAAELILCGHSHTQHVAMAPGKRLVVNPGSVGLPRFVENPATPEQEASAPHAHYAVATRTTSGWDVECIALSYDWNAVLERARCNDRHDFADRFTTMLLQHHLQ